MQVLFNVSKSTPSENGDVSISLSLADDPENHDVRSASVSLVVSSKLAQNFDSALRERVSFEKGGTGPK